MRLKGFIAVCGWVVSMLVSGIVSAEPALQQTELLVIVAMQGEAASEMLFIK